MTWNPNYVRFLDTLDEDIYEYKKYDLDRNAYYESPLAGFMFDTSKLQTESTVVSGIKSEVETALAHGALDDPVGKLNENINKCLDNGLDVIREEAIRQIRINNRQKGNRTKNIQFLNGSYFYERIDRYV